MLIKTETFRDVNGFDEKYAPAYYEDVDLCFKVREKGLRILYCPNSIIFHRLSATTNNCLGFLKTNLVMQNRQKLLDRWQLEMMSSTGFS